MVLKQLTNPEFYSAPYLIRIMKTEDAIEYQGLIEANRERLEDFFPMTVAQTKNLEDTVKFIAFMMQKNQDGERYPFVIENTETGKLCGYTDLKNIVPEIPKGELGFFIDAEEANKGLGRRAVRLIVNWMFEMGFHKIVVRTHETNLPAVRMSQSLGFQLEGKIRADHITSSGEVKDLLYLGLLKDEFVK